MTAQISYQDWSDFLLRVGAVCSPAELHGLLCGILCQGAVANWIDNVRDYMDLLGDQDLALVNSALEAQSDLIGAALTDGHYALQLLLPDEILPVAVRAAGLALWCQGFLHGFGTGGESLAERLDEDTQEALTDLVQIAQLDDANVEGEESEQDLMELIEYARMTLFSITTQLRPLTLAANDIPGPSITRH